MEDSSVPITTVLNSTIFHGTQVITSSESSSISGVRSRAYARWAAVFVLRYATAPFRGQGCGHPYLHGVSVTDNDNVNAKVGIRTIEPLENLIDRHDLDIVLRAAMAR